MPGPDDDEIWQQFACEAFDTVENPYADWQEQDVAAAFDPGADVPPLYADEDRKAASDAVEK